MKKKLGASASIFTLAFSSLAIAQVGQSSGGFSQLDRPTPPLAPPPRLDPNERYKITTCNFPTGAGSCDLVTLASAAAQGLGNDPRNRTELAMKCWLGLVGYQGCWKGDGCNRGDGPLGRVGYLGSNAAGADVYEVRWTHRHLAYLVAPDPNGKTREYMVKAADRYLIKKQITSRAVPILIYARPEDAPPAGCSGGDAQLNPPY